MGGGGFLFLEVSRIFIRRCRAYFNGILLEMYSGNLNVQINVRIEVLRYSDYECVTNSSTNSYLDYFQRNF